ncbi:hypothetical protein THTE_1190 [Thermogutta terrifontis]|uniref:Uncharacterized protein n=1 Tax=Thermogutta terrifontis TaxID=1331910 RepID=A0A286RCV0_9BACT|nr:hypothetical protein THTE_1190 [Thermogutta terrifontis]
MTVQPANRWSAHAFFTQSHHEKIGVTTGFVLPAVGKGWDFREALAHE